MALLEVKDLHTSFFTDAGEVKAVDGVSFQLEHGKVLGIVGESGSGKSVTAYSIMQILAPTGKIVSGSVKLDGQELVGADEKLLRTVRGNKVSIIFQDPMTSPEPHLHRGPPADGGHSAAHGAQPAARPEERALEMLRLVNINEPEKRMKQYPHELSGGMRQRVMIAMALACEPKLLIADEPTTALDVTIQAQILDLMQDLQRRDWAPRSSSSPTIWAWWPRCATTSSSCMPATSVSRARRTRFSTTRSHPYTQGSDEQLHPTAGQQRARRLQPIAGHARRPAECCPRAAASHPGATHAMKVCLQQRRPLGGDDDGHYAACWMTEQP